MDAYEFNLKHQARLPGAISISHVIRQFVYDSEQRPQYIGYAKRGSATSDAAWTVEKLTYTSDGLMQTSRISPANQIFDNYAGLTYA
jgi:hypothetical protein